jgi:hypothetical protein
MTGGLDPADREAVFSDLRAYCRQDTLAMVAILDWLHGRIAG